MSYIDADDAERCGSLDRIEANAARTSCDECWYVKATCCVLDYTQRQVCAACLAKYLAMWSAAELEERRAELYDRMEAERADLIYDPHFAMCGYPEE